MDSRDLAGREAGRDLADKEAGREDSRDLADKEAGREDSRDPADNSYTCHTFCRGCIFLKQLPP